MGDIESVIREAFLLGLMASREGFNGECVFTHCAPSKGLRADSSFDNSEKTFRRVMTANPAFQRLQAEAVARLVGEYGEGEIDG